jgi:hypothetical protein
VAYLTQRFGISSEEAQRRLALQDEVAELTARLRSSLGAKFGRVVTRHGPEHQVVVETLDVEQAQSLVGTVSPGLRAALKVVATTRSEQDVRARVDELVQTLKAGGVPASVGYDPAASKFKVTVASDTALRLAQTLIPAPLLPDVALRVGMTVRDAQAGYTSGDYTYGGWALYASGAPSCTSGFVVRLSDARYGITTAGHCSAANSIWVNGHYVTLTGAGIAYDGGLYDYRVFLTGALTTSGHIAYTNNQPIRGHTHLINSVPGYPNSGYLSIRDPLYQARAGWGDVVCKQGQRTGLSCGEVVDTYYSYVGENGVTRNGMVAVGYSNQRVIGFAGDSGGPVFLETPEGTVKPVGLVSSANGPDRSTPCDTTRYTGCELYYMPVDRINDQQPMQLRTVSSHMSP